MDATRIVYVVMPTTPLDALLLHLSTLRPELTRPGFCNMLVVAVGWILTGGDHAVTQALVETGVAGVRHHEAFHRFFSRGTWEPDALGRVVFDLISKKVEGVIEAVLDDTLLSKKGPEVFGLGCHLDPVRSTKRHKAFAFGHVWVVLSIRVHVPFSRRVWALPVLFRLYRNEKECARRGEPHLKKTQLAVELLGILATWAGTRSVKLAIDNAYCCRTLLLELPTNVVVLGSMRPDAALFEPAKKTRKRQRGRAPSVGARLGTPTQLARRKSIPWQRLRTTLYGRDRVLRYKSLHCLWPQPSGLRLLHVVLVECRNGDIPLRVYFSSQSEMPVDPVLTGYAGRWSTEVTFRDLKQRFGFGHSQARKREAVLRTAPFVGLLFSLLILWFSEGVHLTRLAAPPVRPWYPHKKGFSFTDVLRAAQRALAKVDILAKSASLADLPRTRRAPRTRRLLAETGRRRAA